LSPRKSFFNFAHGRTSPPYSPYLPQVGTFQLLLFFVSPPLFFPSPQAPSSWIWFHPLLLQGDFLSLQMSPPYIFLPSLEPLAFSSLCFLLFMLLPTNPPPSSDIMLFFSPFFDGRFYDAPQFLFPSSVEIVPRLAYPSSPSSSFHFTPELKHCFFFLLLPIV